MTLNPEQVERVIESIEKIKRICNGTDGPAGLSDLDPFKTMEALAQEAISILTPSERVEMEDGALKLCPFCGGKAFVSNGKKWTSTTQSFNTESWELEHFPAVVRCMGCGFERSASETPDSGKYAVNEVYSKARIKAQSLWNTRPLEAAAREQGARDTTKECALKAVKFVVDEDLLTDGSYLSEELYKAIIGDSGKVEK